MTEMPVPPVPIRRGSRTSGRPPQGLRRRRRRRRGPGRCDRGSRRGGVHGDHGSVGVGEVDAAALPRRPGHADERAGLRRRRRPHRAERQAAHRAPSRQGRVRVPGVQPGADAHGAREHHPAARHRRARTSTQAWFDEVVATIGIARPHSPTGRASSPAASSSAWRERGRWCRGRRSCSPTSRPGTSTRSRARSCWRFLRSAVKDHGQTIVMVTHDANAASYADRVIFLADGHVVDEMREPTADRVLDRLKSLEG